VTESFATRFFARHPEIKARVMASEEFAAWRDRFRTVTVDEKSYHVVGGDMLRDSDEVALDWARQHGLVSQEDVDRLHHDEQQKE
jgi:hypothetical protein